jgi:hypothetical protein
MFPFHSERRKRSISGPKTYPAGIGRFQGKKTFRKFIKLRTEHALRFSHFVISGKFQRVSIGFMVRSLKVVFFRLCGRPNTTDEFNWCQRFTDLSTDRFRADSVGSAPQPDEFLRIFLRIERAPSGDLFF